MFDQIPNEILFTVMMGLADPADVANFALVCKRFSAVAADPYIRGKWQAAHLRLGVCLTLYYRRFVDSFAVLLSLRSPSPIRVYPWLRGIAAAANEGHVLILAALLERSVKVKSGTYSLIMSHITAALRGLVVGGLADELRGTLARLKRMRKKTRIKNYPLMELAKIAVKRNDRATLGVIMDFKEEAGCTWVAENLLRFVFNTRSDLEMIKLAVSGPGPPLVECFELACAGGRLDALRFLVEDLGFRPSVRSQKQVVKMNQTEAMRYLLGATDCKVTSMAFGVCSSVAMFELLLTEFRHKWNPQIRPESALASSWVGKDWDLIKCMFDRLVGAGEVPLDSARDAIASGFLQNPTPITYGGMEFALEFAKEIRDNWGPDSRSAFIYSEVEELLAWIFTQTGDVDLLSVLLGIPEFDPGSHGLLNLVVRGRHVEATAALLAAGCDPLAWDGRAVRSAFTLQRKWVPEKDQAEANRREVVTAELIAADPRVDLSLYRDGLLEALQAAGPRPGTHPDAEAEHKAELARILLAED
jgi:hypothetical protein